MELFTKLFWAVCFTQVVQSQMCVSKLLKVFQGYRLQGKPEVDFEVENGVHCAMKCVSEENCRSCNLNKVGERFHCGLYDTVFKNYENVIKDENATVYSIIDDKDDLISKLKTETVQPTSLTGTGSVLSTTTVGYKPSLLISSTSSQDKSVILPSLPQLSWITSSVLPSNVPAVACRRLYEDKKSLQDGAYLVFPGSQYEATVFCDMTGDKTGCGGEGWTLVMKTDGSKDNFKYSSALWTNKDTFEPSHGDSLDKTWETKLSTYWSTPFTKICLGMSYNNYKRWKVIEIGGSSLYDLISSNQHHATTLKVSSWQELIPGGGSLQENCPLQGINVQLGDTGVRIGIIATKTCNVDEDYNSRLGFGMKGESCGQDGTNTCGNDARCKAKPKDSSIKTFGYILVK